MVAGGNECHAALACHMHVLFGNFSGNKSIHAQRHSGLEIALRRPGAPGNAVDSRISLGYYLRWTLQNLGDIFCQLRQRLRLRQLAVTRNILLAKAALFDESQALAQLCVVA